MRFSFSPSSLSPLFLPLSLSLSRFLSFSHKRLGGRRSFRVAFASRNSRRLSTPGLVYHGRNYGPPSQWNPHLPLLCAILRSGFFFPAWSRRANKNCKDALISSEYGWSKVGKHFQRSNASRVPIAQEYRNRRKKEIRARARAERDEKAKRGRDCYPFTMQFAGVQAINTAILDRRPDLRKYEAFVILGICAACWLLAIPMVFDGGIYLFKLMDWHTASWAILLIGFAEVVIASWFYGCNKFLDNLAEMKMKFGRYLRGFWWLCWVVLAPLTCLVSAHFTNRPAKPPAPVILA